MHFTRYHLESGATASCIKRLMVDMKGLGQRALKWSTRDFFLLESWFSSKKAADAYASIGVNLISMVEKNTKGFCKAKIEGSTKDWPGGSYIVLRSKPMVPGERPLLAIGHN